MKQRLFTPGPTTVPEQVLLNMAVPIIHHRSSQFAELFQEVNEGLKVLFQTEREVLTLTASGTGAMEAAVVNTLSKADRVLVVQGGKFGERWGEICTAYGVEVQALDVPWGHPVDPMAIRQKLDQDPGIKAVFTTQSETSTGVLHDIEAIGRTMADHGALFIVDAITGIGVQRLLPDQWGVDVVVTGSQKALMLPPGLAFISLSDQAWRAVDTSDLPKYYWDLRKARAALAKNQTPYTPAVSLLEGLKESIAIIRAEGIENVWARHARHAKATRAAVRALGLDIYARRPSNVLTIIALPEALDGQKLIKRLDAYGFTVAGGQEQLKGKVIRISHLGYMDDFDLLSIIGGLERALADLGWAFEPGAGLTAAQRVLSTSTGVRGLRSLRS